MNPNTTNVPTIAAAGAITTLIMWIMGHYNPGLMADAPQGAEAAITTIIAVVAGRLSPAIFPFKNGGNQDGRVDIGVLVMLVVMVAFAVAMSGCQSAKLDDTIATTSIAIETTATAVHEACGNTEPDGPCVNGLITTEQKTILKQWLQEAVDCLDLAVLAYQINDTAVAAGYLDKAQRAVEAVKGLLP